jgi:hypoxanthine phosphoribosyltransferase
MKGGREIISATEEDGCSNCNPQVNAAMMAASIASAPQISNETGGKEPCSWFEIHYLVKEIARQITGNTKKQYDCILGIANGGIIPAKLLAEELGVDGIQLIPMRNKQVVISELPPMDKSKKYLVIDDIHDTGNTYKKVLQVMGDYNCDYAFCMSRYEQDFGVCGRVLNHARWIVFPWEKEIY